ncbi:MAG: hypothetical protein KatS3mg031_0721 [Chitinophagales bacterium]|nr:MAG: hypothetical protein KatS3mg031_0721 [Chitinophagales bacterium]
MSAQAFSIIIPTWNNLDFLRTCVGSIRQNSAWRHEIVVHVNEGVDGTLQWLQSEGIAFTHSISNIGVCKAFNTALTRASRPVIAFLNDDMYVLPGWDEALLHIMPDTDAWMISATMIEPRHTGNPCVVVADYGSDLTSFREEQLLADYSSLKRADWSGSSWPPVLMPASLWRKAGGLSEEFSPGLYSDPDLAMKVWQAGVRYFRGAGNSLVYHFQCRSTSRIKPNNGRLTFMKKWRMTPSFFYRHYLRMGQPWQGELHSAGPSELRKRLNRLRVGIQTLLQ